MQHLPNEIIGHICSFLTGPELDQLGLAASDLERLGLVDKYLRLALQSESVVLPNKQKMFYDRWKLIKKLDSLPISISEKLKRKISLQQNWKNPEFVPVVRKLNLVGTDPVIDHLLHHNLLVVARQGQKNEQRDEWDNEICYEIYDTETLKLVQRLKLDFSGFDLHEIVNDRYVILSYYEISKYAERLDIIVWDVKSNTTKLYEVINDYKMRDNLLFYVSALERKFKICSGEKIIFEKEAFAIKFDIDYDKRMVAIADETHLTLITYSPDWSKEIDKKILALQRVKEPDLTNLTYNVKNIRLRDNYYVVTFNNASHDTLTRVFDRNTLQELYEAEGYSKFSPREKCVGITGRKGNILKIFDVRSGKTITAQGKFRLHQMHGYLYHKEYIRKSYVLIDTTKNPERDSMDRDDKMVILPQFEELPHLSNKSLCQIIKSSGFDLPNEEPNNISGNEAQLVVSFAKEGKETDIFILDFCDSIISE